MFIANFLLSLFVGKEKRILRRYIKKIVGFHPLRIEYYQIAFTHKSVSIKRNGVYINNERLEFLGDAILDAVVSDYLYKLYPNAYEGFLTRMRSSLVNGDMLNELAHKLGLQYLIHSNTGNSNRVKHIYEDAFEAFIGAMYLDRGYYKTYQFIEDRILNSLVDVDLLSKTDTNYKSQMIEWSQKNKISLSFRTDFEKDDIRNFFSYVVINDKEFSKGYGKSKKEAEQDAAQIAIQKLKEQN